MLCKSMTIPRNPVAHTYSVIYTDAYFKLGQKIYRPGRDDLPSCDSNSTKDIENGWAAVCFHQVDVHNAAHFKKGDSLRFSLSFSSDQAFIYFLEAWAAILAPSIFEPWLGCFYIQCCDKEASRHALIKGVGKHQPLNCLIASPSDLAQSSGNISSARMRADRGECLRCPQSIPRYRRSQLLAQT